jgi:hypothetical protein
LYLSAVDSAETDYFVSNRGIMEFVKKAPATRLFTVPGTYHELLQEKPEVRDACKKVICDFFLQKSDSVQLVEPCYPLEVCDTNTKPLFTYKELLMRGAGLMLAAVGVVAGCSMILAGGKR